MAVYDTATCWLYQGKQRANCKQHVAPTTNAPAVAAGSLPSQSASCPAAGSTRSAGPTSQGPRKCPEPGLGDSEWV